MVKEESSAEKSQRAKIFYEECEWCKAKIAVSRKLEKWEGILCYICDAKKEKLVAQDEADQQYETRRRAYEDEF